MIRFFAFLILCAGLCAEEYRADFNKDAAGWRIESGKELRRSPIPGRKDDALLFSGNVRYASPVLALKPGERYELLLNTWSGRPGELRIHIREFDESGKLVTPQFPRTLEQLWLATKFHRKFVLPMTIPFDTALNGGRIQIVIDKWGREDCWVDDISIRKAAPREYLATEPTPATEPALMLEGPDGVTYPNWRLAGLRTPFPEPAQKFFVRDFGAIPDDGTDDSDAIERACKAAEKAGGTVVFDKGVYRLTRKILITRNGIVLRGAGRDKTRIVFELPDSGVGLYPVSFGANICPQTKCVAVFPAKEAKRVEISAGGKEILAREAASFLPADRAPEFRKIEFTGAELTEKLPRGRHDITVRVAYADGSIRDTTAPFFIAPGENWNTFAQNAVFTFRGTLYSNPRSRIPVQNDLKRGDREIVLADASQFKAGGYICLDAPPTPRWNRQTANACQWGTFRRFVTRIESVQGSRIRLEQPLRVDFPLVDKTGAMRFAPIENCGVEDFTLEQKGVIQTELKTGSIVFANAVNFRAERVRVENTGFAPLYGYCAKWCEIRDCEFNGAWNTRDTYAYLGFDTSWDCLVERVNASRLRHGPLLNWACSGNVFRECTMREMDAQWHSGWCTDNLFEQCRIESTTTAHKGYGYGFYATPWDDSMHGPQGQRNVIYNCTSVSLKSAVYLGGMNRNWRIMYNTFTVDSGPGILLRLNCGDIRIQGNVFILKDPAAPMLWSEFLDNRGNLPLNNRIYGGSGQLAAGPGKAEKGEGNAFYPYTPAPPPAKPPVPSIYRWQKTTK